MGTNFRQNSDGSIAFVDDLTGLEVNRFGGTGYRDPIMARLILAGGVDTGGGLGAWQNNTGGDVVVTGLVVDITTKATAACTLSAGQTATSATTSSANLIDTLDVGTAAGTFDNITDKGTNGKSRQKVANGKWVTFSRATGASAGLVGVAYITYVPV